MDSFLDRACAHMLRRRRNYALIALLVAALFAVGALFSLPDKESVSPSYIASFLMGLFGLTTLLTGGVLLFSFLSNRRKMHRYPFVQLLTDGSLEQAVRAVNEGFDKGQALVFIEKADGKSETLLALPDYFVLVARASVYIVRSADVSWAYLTDDASRGPARSGGGMRGYEMTLHYGQKQLSTPVKQRAYGEDILTVLSERHGVMMGYDLDLREMFYKDHDAFLRKVQEHRATLPPKELLEGEAEA